MLTSQHKDWVVKLQGAADELIEACNILQWYLSMCMTSQVMSKYSQQGLKIDMLFHVVQVWKRFQLTAMLCSSCFITVAVTADLSTPRSSESARWQSRLFR